MYLGLLSHQKEASGCYIFWRAPPSLCVAFEPAVSLGSIDSVQWLLWGEKNPFPRQTALSRAILVIRFRQHRSRIWTSSFFSYKVHQVLSLNQAKKKTHYTEMIYKQINFSCSCMVSQNYSSSSESRHEISLAECKLVEPFGESDDVFFFYQWKGSQS